MGPKPPLRVLIADDSAPVADMLAELVTQAGEVEVVGVAASEADSLKAIRSLKPDVVVLDLQLAAGSGANVVKAVRADPTLASLRVLVTSNHVSAPLRAGCLELGADGFYDKVKELGALARRVGEIAEAR